MNSQFLILNLFALLTLNVISIYGASIPSTEVTSKSEKYDLAKLDDLVESNKSELDGIDKLVKTIRFLRDYSFTHERVLDYLGIEFIGCGGVAQELQRACFIGSPRDISNLIQGKVDIRMHNDMAIKTASGMNHNHIVKGLFNYGCNSEDVIEYILKTAARNGNSDLVQFTLGTESCGNDSKSIGLAEAVRFGYLDIVKIIFESRVGTDEFHGYLIKLAQIKGFAEIIEFISGKGMKIRIEICDYLMMASKLGHIEVVKFLLERDANVHADDEFVLRWATNVHARNDYALRWTSYNGHTSVVKLLRKYGASVHAEDDFAFRLASCNGHTSLVKLLVQYGADVHARNDYALRLASLNGHTSVVKLLLENHANVHAEDNQALKSASANGHTTVVELLVQYGAHF